MSNNWIKTKKSGQFRSFSNPEYVLLEREVRRTVNSMGVGSTVWGSITGNITDQADLTTALLLKENVITAGTTSQYWRGDKTWQTLDKNAVGLGNVVNIDTSTTLNITDSISKRFITDAQITIINNTSGVNTGDNATNSQYAGLAASKEDVANKGVNNGYAGLDSGGKIPLANLPSTLLKYMGVWDASTNTPTLTNPDLTKVGNVYNVSVAGTQFGIDFSLGDWLIYNASGIPEKSDNSDDVVSVNGQTGVVTLTTANISDTTNRRYVTDANLTTINSFPVDFNLQLQIINQNILLYATSF